MKVFCNHSVLDSSRSHQHNANTGSITSDYLLIEQCKEWRSTLYFHLVFYFLAKIQIFIWQYMYIYVY